MSNAQAEQSSQDESLWSEAQILVINSYQEGEFSYMAEPEACELNGSSPEQVRQALMDECGDGLLRFLLVELSKSEDCNSLDEAVRRIDKACDQLREVAQAIEAESASQALRQTAPRG